MLKETKIRLIDSLECEGIFELYGQFYVVLPMKKNILITLQNKNFFGKCALEAK